MVNPIQRLKATLDRAAPRENSTEKPRCEREAAPRPSGPPPYPTGTDPPYGEAGGYAFAHPRQIECFGALHT